MLESVGQYFNDLADALDAQSKTAKSQSHRTSNGANREVFVRDFLNKHLPSQLKAVQCGQVYGLDQPPSKQIDIVVTHDAGINFDFLSVPFSLAEHIVAAVSVKTYLDKASLFDALDGLASIPRSSNKVRKMGLSELFSKVEFNKVYPRYFVFAFDGISAKAITRNLEEYGRTKGFDTLTPVVVFVNRKYFALIKKNPETGELIANGGKITATDSGWPLLWMISDISQATGWLNEIAMDYEPYYKQMFK